MYYIYQYSLILLIIGICDKARAKLQYFIDNDYVESSNAKDRGRVKRKYKTKYLENI